MIKKIILISFAIITVLIISFLLFISWLSLGGCPAEYWIETEVVTETSFPITNITRNDFPDNLTLRNMLINLAENDTLDSIFEEVSFTEWNMTKSLLDASDIVPTESFTGMWQGYVYFENILVHIQLLILVC